MIRSYFLLAKELIAIMCLTKMKNKKADIPIWGYIVGLIIGLFVLALIIVISIKSKGGMIGLLGQIRP